MKKDSKKALVIGGSNGIGLSIALQLADCCQSVSIVDKNYPDDTLPENIHITQCNLLNNDFGFLADFDDVDILVFTAGFGRIAPFETFIDKEIENAYTVNSIALTKVLRHFFLRMKSKENFYCAVMGSIAGLVSSPLFSLYGATKAAVCKLVESVNIELEMSDSANRILCVSPGSIKGTKFNGALFNDLTLTNSLAQEIVRRMFSREQFFIPDYEKVYKNVLDRYYADPHLFGVDSYQYKEKGGRINLKPQLKVGYLSGTFDLFHIGHLNMLRRAKEYCDFLVVGVHKDASHKGKQTFIPFEERCNIVRSIKYVDEVIQSEPEDDDIYKKGIVKYDFLFVGSDYKGSERFQRYERFFADKNVQIIYFPYTQGTSSTQLRESLDAIAKQNK
ncbi:MAG: SDR family NAD(P)-dependent oxidoreductase [Bacteroidaceae bacterium]|nr:SDR family NAD(P)-dependent oxidoreductase [Bacteroidaceae bacterium]MBP5322635.1 SDR family NAD(P)-dependent oxidoreductase [Bacteroidaceae bacterium]